MIEFYPQIRAFHIGCVIASGCLFALRGGLVQAGLQRWAMLAPLRYLSYTIDCALLTAALMLLTILPHAMFANGWLWVKLTLVVVYIVLGVYALRRGRSARTRLISFLLALLMYGLAFSIARYHHPLGALLPLLG